MHAFVKDSERAECHAVTDGDTLAAFKRFSSWRGLSSGRDESCASVSDHSLPASTRRLQDRVELSRQGDKDVNSVMKYLKL